MGSLTIDTTMADLVNINGDNVGDVMDIDLDGMALNLGMGLDPGSLVDDAVLESVEINSNSPPDHDHQGLDRTNSNDAVPMSGAGAGPLPTNYGAQSSHLNTGSTLTEFTKRRNWSQRVLEELKDFLYILTPDRRIQYVSSSLKSLTGHEPSEVVGKFIVDFVHADDAAIFTREFNESINTGHPLRFFHRFRKADGTYTIFESHGHPHFASEATSFQNTNTNPSVYCRGFFMMARPYPTKNAGLLDSFLEHKIENERLSRRIADLKREEAEDLEAQHRSLAKHQNGTAPSDPTNTTSNHPITPSESRESETPGSASYSGGPGAQNGESPYNGMPPPAKPGSSNTALTQKNLDEALASSRPDSITDKMARYEGATHIEGIEMMTGLHYGDGERAHGISTGDAGGTLIRGDAGIVIPVDKDAANRGPGASGLQGGTGGPPGGNAGSSGDKKKKLKLADEYVCTDCGTLDSPEWRKGPSGPKTLCNACGLRWAKKEKKRTVSVGGAQGRAGPMGPGVSVGGMVGQGVGGVGVGQGILPAGGGEL